MVNPQKSVKAFDTEVNVVDNDDPDVTNTGLRQHVQSEKNKSDLGGFLGRSSFVLQTQGGLKVSDLEGCLNRIRFLTFSLPFL